MTITNVKAMIVKAATATLVAGALLLATPTKANAQVRVGIGFGAPIVAHGYVRPYYAPPAYGYGYYHPGFYGDYGYRRHEEFERHEAFERREQFARHEEHERFEHGYR